MRFVITFVFLAGLVLLLSAIFQVSIDIRRTPSGDGSFASRLDQPVRLAIVGRQEEVEALRAALSNADTRQIIDPDAAPSSFEDADAVVFLLNGWAEISAAPWQDRFERDYTIIAEGGDDSVSLSMGDGDRPLKRTYYNLQTYPDWGFECYAALFLHDVGSTPGSSIVLPRSCP